MNKAVDGRAVESALPGARIYTTVSESGTLVYTPASASLGKTALVWVDRDGKEELIAAQPDVYSSPSISPDGTRLALTVAGGGNTDIWIWDIARKILSRLTFEKGADANPLWSPDSKRIVYGSDREGKVGIYWKAADGTGEAERLASVSGDWLYSLCWAGDAGTLVFEGDRSGVMFRIASLSTEGDRALKPLMEDKAIIANPHVSPDGKWMAYLSQESGRIEIYVRPFPNVNSGKWQISTNGGQEPRWSPDGRELFFRNGDAMAARIETEPAFKAGVPEKLFERNITSANSGSVPARQRQIRMRPRLRSASGWMQPCSPICAAKRNGLGSHISL